MNLEEIMNRNWKKVRAMYFHPSMPQPEIVENIPGAACQTAAYNSVSKKIQVNRDFVEHNHKQGMNYDDIFFALLSHEIAHHMYCPFNLMRMMKINLAASQVDEKNANLTAGYYMDIMVNLELMLNKNVKPLEQLLSLKPTE